MPKRNRRSTLLVDVLAAMGDVRIRERYLIDKSAPRKNFQYGEQQDGVIVINPAPSIAVILLHELIHQVRPDWTEVTVRQWTTRLSRELTHQEVQAIYEQYIARREVG